MGHVGMFVVTAVAFGFQLDIIGADQPGAGRGIQAHDLDAFAIQLQLLQDKMLHQERVNARLLTAVQEQDQKRAKLEKANKQEKRNVVMLERKVAVLERENVRERGKVAMPEQSLLELERYKIRQKEEIALLREAFGKCEGERALRQSAEQKPGPLTREKFGDSNELLTGRPTKLSDLAEGKDNPQYESKQSFPNRHSPVNASSTTFSTLPPRIRVIASRSDDVNPLEVGLAVMTQRLTNMAAKMAELETCCARQVDANAGSVFTRWGSSSCGDHAEQVYNGTVGGSHYIQGGGASNYLCLPPNPAPSHRHAPPMTAAAFLYGGEYETHDSHENQDPACAVCRATLPTTVMIPATNACPPAWTRQYAGVLMAGSYNSAAASEFICVDDRLESVPGSQADLNGKLLFFTQTICGSLPCPPYTDRAVVTCVVCSK